MTSPLRDRMFLHLSTQPRGHDQRLAAIADGVVLQAPFQWAAAREIARGSAHVIFQHDGRVPTEPTLFPPDDDWLHYQDGVAAVTSRTVVFADPAETTAPTVRNAVAELNTFCERARALGKPSPAASVAADRRWLTSQVARSRLTEALRDVDPPIHLMLSNSADPLESEAAVEGLVHVVSSVPEVAVVRCDHGALGAYAFGALGGSIGATGGTRHFVPPGSSGKGFFDDPTPRVFLPVPLAWWRGSRLALTDDPLFDCPCVHCEGRSVGRFQNEMLLPEADFHSVEAWMSIVRALRDAAPGEARQERWIAICREAMAGLDELDDRSEIVQQPSKQLKAWLRFAGVPAW